MKRLALILFHMTTAASLMLCAGTIGLSGWGNVDWMELPGGLRLRTWLVIILSAILPLAVGIWQAADTVRYVRGYRRWNRGRCIACGYDLRASPDRCPECGRKTDAAPERPRPQAGKAG